MLRVQRERGPAVLEVDARGAIHHARSEPGGVGLDQADRVPVSVHDGEVDRPTDEGAGWRRDGIGMTGIDPRRELRRVLPRQEPLHGHLAERRVRQVRVAVGVDELCRLELAVDPGGVGPAAAVESGTH